MHNFLGQKDVEVISTGRVPENRIDDRNRLVVVILVTRNMKLKVLRVAKSLQRTTGNKCTSVQMRQKENERNSINCGRGEEMVNKISGHSSRANCTGEWQQDARHSDGAEYGKL